MRVGKDGVCGRAWGLQLRPEGRAQQIRAQGHLPQTRWGQKHLQFSAVPRHFEATKWGLCIDGIVAVDPGERVKRSSVTWRGLSWTSALWALWLLGTWC